MIYNISDQNIVYFFFQNIKLIKVERAEIESHKKWSFFLLAIFHFSSEKSLHVTDV